VIAIQNFWKILSALLKLIESNLFHHCLQQFFKIFIQCLTLIYHLTVVNHWHYFTKTTTLKLLISSSPLSRVQSLRRIQRKINLPSLHLTSSQPGVLEP